MNPGREPHRIVVEYPDTCCSCGEPTRSGIYERADPADRPHHWGHGVMSEARILPQPDYGPVSVEQIREQVWAAIVAVHQTHGVSQQIVDELMEWIELYGATL